MRGIVMNDMMNSIMDKKNIGLLKTLWELRQALDVYSLIAGNWDAIQKGGVGKNFFIFLRESCLHLITLDTCKVFEKEKDDKQGRVKYEVNSIEGVLRSHAIGKPDVLDPGGTNDFVRKYSHGRCEDGTLSAISLTVEDFRGQYRKELDRFKTVRDKWVAHSDFGFTPESLPSYDIMERLFDFGHDFYRVVSRAFISVGPTDLNTDRPVKANFRRVLKSLGMEEIRTDME
jgi:hypothetical protein